MNEHIQALQSVLTKMRAEEHVKQQGQRTLRWAVMKSHRDNGWTLQRIGDKYNMSKQRVHQILGNTGRISLGE